MCNVSIALTYDRKHPRLPTHAGSVTFRAVFFFFTHQRVLLPKLPTCLMYQIVWIKINKCARGEAIAELAAVG